MIALLPGNSGQQADAEQAYTQALLKGRNTWVELPREQWPPEWEGMRRPVCPLLRALYGHPDSGSYWETECTDRVVSVGFRELNDAGWRNCYGHDRLQLSLSFTWTTLSLQALPTSWRRVGPS